MLVGVGLAIKWVGLGLMTPLAATCKPPLADPSPTTPREFDICPLPDPSQNSVLALGNCRPFALQAIVDANTQSTKQVPFKFVFGL